MNLIKDLSKAWDDAAQCVLETCQDSELTSEQLSKAAGLHVRSGVMAGSTVFLCSDNCTMFEDCP